MIITVSLVLVLLALGVTIAAAAGRAPLWIAVFVLAVLHLIGLLPVR